MNDDQTPTATHQIYEYIESALVRQSSTEVNRASAASTCPKKRWYQRNGYEGETMNGRAIINFALGDLTEHMVKYFITQALVGPGKLYSEVDFGVETGRFTIQNGYEVAIHSQPDLIAYIGGITVSAHADGWGKRNSDNKWELIEVKSAADYGFEKFKEIGPEDYLKQAMVNLQTNKAKELGATDVRFFYLKKNTGHLWDRLYPFDKTLAAQVADEYRVSNQTEEPKPYYSPELEMFRKKPTGRMKLPWQCSYCAYTKHCHPSATLEFNTNGSPVYVIGTKTTKGDEVA